jgi:hypothetical protein
MIASNNNAGHILVDGVRVLEPLKLTAFEEQGRVVGLGEWREVACAMMRRLPVAIASNTAIAM